MTITPFSKLLIANRGEIACRVIRTARRMGMTTVAVYSDADAEALHVQMADEAVRIGPAQVGQSYLNAGAILAAARASGAQAIHPGYGFLSENPDFVEAVAAAGLIFVGPSAASIRAMGLKDGAKHLMEAAGVPVVPGYHGPNQDAAFLAEEARRIGYPVLIKARAGGGGKGMRRVDDPADFADALASAQREGKSSFGDDRVLIEKYITAPRHIEVQVFGDRHGNVVHLFERDCSLQRRHQKVIEEAPAPGMSEAVRAAMTDAAVKAAKAIDYAGAGTIEFIADGSGPLRPDGFWFMEMNTRLQVEHPVTEYVTGLDLVEWQLRVAMGEPLPLNQDQITLSGHAFEARLYAEDPANGFLPQTGRIEHLLLSNAARNDAGVRAGDSITPFYDPMIAKIIVGGETREAALARFGAALRETHVAGTVTNVAFLAALAEHPDFARGTVDTGLIERHLTELTATTEPDPAAILVAALFALDIDPAADFIGWRLWGVAQHRVRLELQGESHAYRLALPGDGFVRLERDGLAVDGSHFQAKDGRFEIRIGDTRARRSGSFAIYETARGRAVSIQMHGATHEFLLPDPLLSAGDHGEHGDELRAPMTGTVTSVLAAKGDVVEKGAKLVVMEAMKMETTLIAPRDGIIAEIACHAGSGVEGGGLLLRLEPSA